MLAPFHVTCSHTAIAVNHKAKNDLINHASVYCGLWDLKTWTVF